MVSASGGDTLLARGTIVGETGPSDLRIVDGRVMSIEPASDEPADLGSESAVIGPPLFDIQVNGACGVDLQGAQVRPEDVRAISDHLLRSGVGHWVPTLITASLDDMARGCRAIAEAMARDETVRRAVPGIHLEGPFISRQDGPRGAHPAAHVRPPSLDDFDRLLEAADGRVLYTTVAPEVEGAIAFIEAVAGRGVVVALGHHEAHADHITAAVEAGAALCTHLGNGLASRIHRHHNPLWPQLAEDRLACSLIADLEHLPPPMLKSLVRAKSPENVILVSDCVHIAGLPPGEYRLGGHPVDLSESGRIRLRGTDMLAGSALMLIQGLANAVAAGAMTLPQAHAAASTVPGALFGLEHLFTPPRADAPAHMVIYTLDPEGSGSRARIDAVFLGGARKA